jgi:hypothetical protein
MLLYQALVGFSKGHPAPALDTQIPDMLENLEAAGNNLRAGVYSDFVSKGHAEGKEMASTGFVAEEAEMASTGFVAEGKEMASTGVRHDHPYHHLQRREAEMASTGLEVVVLLFHPYLAFGEAFYYIEAMLTFYLS